MDHSTFMLRYPFIALDTQCLFSPISFFEILLLGMILGIKRFIHYLDYEKNLSS